MDIAPINEEVRRMNARKQAASQRINGSILAVTTNLRKGIRENLPKMMTAMVFAVCQAAITGWFVCFRAAWPNEPS